MVTRRNALALLAGLALLARRIPAALGQQEPRTRSRFGIVEAYYRPADAQDLGVGWERIIFEWAQFQPYGPGEYRSEAVPEAWLWNDEIAGREVVGLLKNTPYWASGTTLLGMPPQGLDRPIDDPLNYWAAFVRQTVQYYAQRWGIHHWIIYNEPDIRPGDLPWYEFDGRVEDYYRMLKVAALAARSVDPDAVIHLAGMAWYVDVSAGREPYLKRLLEVAAHDPDAYDCGFFFDVVTVHCYFETESLWEITQAMRDILKPFKLHDKPIWVDETNASPSLDPAALLPGAAYAVGLDQQADYIVQAAALALAAGVERFGVYRLYDDRFVPGQSESWGLVRADGSRRPAFTAYQTVVRLFSGVLHAARCTSDHSSLVTLQTASETIHVMWARFAPPVIFYVAADAPGAEATQVGLDGTTRRVQSRAVSGAEGTWYVIAAPGAQAAPSGRVIVAGSPQILVVDGPPGAVWVEFEGRRWRLR